jgi:hypothetical protein
MSASCDNSARPDEVIARFVNLGGAVVELHTARFMTHWTYAGPPHAAVQDYEVDGWNWRCLGCAAYGRESDTYKDPGFRKLAEARSEAQQHAAMCRAIPDTPACWEYLVESYRDKWVTFEDILARHCRSGWDLVTVDWDARKVVFKRSAGGAR